MQSTEFENKSKLFKILRIVKWTLLGIVIAVIFALVFGLAVQWMWSVTLSPLFGFSVPTYWQAVGLVVLARLIFGGFHHGEHGKFERAGWHANGRRDIFLQKLHNRFHGWEHNDSQDQTFHIPGEHRQHYRDFWEKEGKAAFAVYLNGLKTDKE